MSDASNGPGQEADTATSPSKRKHRCNDRNDETRGPKLKTKTAPVDKTKDKVIEEHKHKVETEE